VATIDPGIFAKQCLTKAVNFEIFAHYLIGVAQLRSGISDDAQGDLIGPFRLNQAEWDQNRQNEDFGVNYDSTDITGWRAQCSVFALMTRQTQDRLKGQLNRNPSPVELYMAQWPTANAPTLSADLQTAFDSTAAALTQAAADLQRVTDPASTVIKDPARPGPAAAGDDDIIAIAAASPFAKFRWDDRGVAPIGYIKGMALAFATALRKLNASEPAAKEMAKPNTGDDVHDVFAFYDDVFRHQGMSNGTDVGEVDRLRHLFTLLIGLGMRESSGKFCTGRDGGADNKDGETAEAGLFQVSFNACRASSLLKMLFEQFSTNPSGFKETFQEGVACKAADLKNWGTGPGVEFQRLTKDSPLFAAEFAAVALRNVRKQWGPIDRKEAQVVPECDGMLLEVQHAVNAPAIG
jgi:hypothetical protein